MIDVSIVVAYDEGRVIGKDGQIPWHIPKDLYFFKRLTWGGIVIMGRKTWESIPAKFRPLHGCANIIVTSSVLAPSINEDGSICCPNFLEAIRFAKEAIEHGMEGYRPHIYIIGGGSIYRQALDEGVVNSVYVSEIKGLHEGDTFFPPLGSEWKLDGPINDHGEFLTMTYVR